MPTTPSSNRNRSDCLVVVLARTDMSWPRFGRTRHRGNGLRLGMGLRRQKPVVDVLP